MTGTRMFNFFEQAVHKVSQSMEDYDEKIDTVHQVFKGPYAEELMKNTLLAVSENLEDMVSDTINNLSSDLGTPWRNAIFSFVEELGRYDFDTSQIDIDDLANRTKEEYINRLRSAMYEFFNEWKGQTAEVDTADAVFDEVSSAITEGFRPQ